MTVDDDRWAWRARIRRRPTAYLVYRVLIGLVGSAVVILGIIAIPAPGPGWLIVFVGLGILASEFDRADRLLDFARRQVSRWTRWMGRQSLWLRGAVGLATLALVLGIFWVSLAVTGVPTWLPEWAAELLQRVPGVS